MKNSLMHIKGGRFLLVFAVVRALTGTGCLPSVDGIQDAQKITCELASETTFTAGPLKGRVTAYDEADKSARTFSVEIENTGERPMYIDVDSSSSTVNGFSNPMFLSPSELREESTIGAHELVEYDLSLDEDMLRYAGIDSVGTVSVCFEYHDKDNWDYLRSDPVILETTRKDLADGRDFQQTEPLLSDDDVRIYYLGCSDDGWNKHFIFCLQNTGTGSIVWKVNDIRYSREKQLDGLYLSTGIAAPGTCGLIDVCQSELEMVYSPETYSLLTGSISWTAVENDGNHYGSEYDRTESFEVHPDFSNPLW